MIITFSGIDCAGKSTQIERLDAALRGRGHRIHRTWFRPGYSTELDALRRAVRRLRPGTLPSAGASQARTEAFARPNVRRTWVAMAVADTLLQIALKVRARSLAGWTVLCDRWLDDAALDLSFRFPDLERVLTPTLAAVRAACPRPDVSFLLMLPHEEMLRRMEIKAEPFPDAPEVRDRRYHAYADLARTGRFEVIDATPPIEVIHQGLLDRIPGR